MSDAALNFDDLTPTSSPTLAAAERQGATETRDGELEAVYDVPVRVRAVLGRTLMDVSDLLKLSTGDVIELDKRAGDAVDIFVNERLVARGEVVLVDDNIGVTMTEIVKDDRG